MTVRIKKPKFDEIIFGDGVIGQVLNHRYKSSEDDEFIIDFVNLPRIHKLPVRKDGRVQLILKKKWLYLISADPAYHRYLYIKNVYGGPTIFDEYKKLLREKNAVLTKVRDSLFLENLYLKDRFNDCWRESNVYLQRLLAKNEQFIPPQTIPLEETQPVRVEEDESVEENL